MGKFITDKILLPNKRDVLRLHLYCKFLEYRIKPSENDIDLLLDLHAFGGYAGKQEQQVFINQCLEKKMKKSAQSVRNTLSKYTTLKVLYKPKNTYLRANEEFIPGVDSGRVILQSIVSHHN